ncbi:MAG: DUF4080 domain-containing protein [Clostridiaceae bacterium]|jgi:radical SAM superfamily enzyme YgiQ (UPF0313 family)|nr:DUF4080 domain-containing protein [Clostridiaceae bacterium]
MRTLLVAINSQFVHTNLAILYLKSACSEIGNVDTVEFSINDPIHRIYSGIVRQKPDVVAFSCYIWNIELVSKLCEDLKKALPNIIIIAGGPEVSFENGGLLADKKSVDYIIGGEGEDKLHYLLELLANNSKPNEQEMLWLKDYSEVRDLSTLKLPYKNIEKGSLTNKIAYIEASRGCPFKCAYCMSSVTSGVRYFPLNDIYDAVDTLAESGSLIIKFIDRTFNCNEKRAIEIWNYILKYSDRGIVFHFEIDPGLLTENMLNCLEKMPRGLVQIEAGIQSIHEKTLTAVQRHDDINKALLNIAKLLSFENIHVHVDLIAGLPFESYNSFKQSFNKVYSLFAHHFQLGFLKLLRGSSLKKNAYDYGYLFQEYPPYEIIQNSVISPTELLKLKDIEACMDYFYNSSRFVMTMKLINSLKVAPFDFYENLSFYMRQNGYLDRAIKVFDLYEILYVYIKNNFPSITYDLAESLRFDYLSSMKNPSLPSFMQKPGDGVYRKERKSQIKLFQNELQMTLPRLKHLSLDKIRHQIYISRFDFSQQTHIPQNSLVVFDFGDTCPVTGLANSYILP